MLITRKDRRARTGSSIPGTLSVDQRSSDLGRRAAVLEKLARRYRSQTRKSFSKTDRQRIVSTCNEINGEWQQASIEGGREARRSEALQVSARRKTRRILAREFPQFVPWQKLRKQYLVERRKILRPPVATMGDLALGDHADLALREYTRPFRSWRVDAFQNWEESRIHDDSYVIPGSGDLVQDMKSVHDDFGIGMDAVFGAPLPYYARSLVTCGVPYVTPTAGRLRLGATLQNLYSFIDLSLKDYFGFSGGDLYVSVNAAFVVVQSHQTTELRVTLKRDGLISHGDDLSVSWNGFDKLLPYTASVTTERRFNAGDTLIVLAGTEIVVESEMNDMKSIVRGMQWWRLQKLYIGMAQ